jgi:predicted phosphate transport protein (TIGR00153 family)
MSFPRETEAQIRRSVLDTEQEQIRRVLDSTRELTNMVSEYVEQDSKNLESRLVQIKKLKEEAGEQKTALISQLAESGMLLMNREDFLHLAVQVGEIVDLCEGAAYRVIYITTHKVPVDQETKQALLSLSKNVLKTVTNLRETILSLSYNRQKALDIARNVEIAEYAVDEIFRDLEFRIFESKMDTRTTLLLWSFAGLLEDMSDKAEDAIDSIRILALGV